MGQGQVSGWLKLKRFAWKKCRHLLFSKIHQFKPKNQRNLVFIGKHLKDLKAEIYETVLCDTVLM